MTLQNIQLQSIGETIASGASDWLSTISSSIGIIAVIVLLLAGGFALLMFIVWAKRRFDFEGEGDPIGRCHIEIMGKYALEGNVAKWQLIEDEQLDLLKEDETLGAVPDVIRQMYNEGNLFIYTMKSPDDADIRDKFGNRTFIISSGDFTSDKYYWYSQKGKFTFRSIFSKEKTRNLAVYSSAKKIQVLNEDRNLDDWWVMSPIPVVDPKEEWGFNSKAVGGMRHNITIKIIENAKALASALNFLPYVIKAETVNKFLKQENAKKDEIIEERTTQLYTANQKVQKKTRQLGQKHYVVGGKVEETKKTQQNVMMMLVSVVMGSMAVMFVPDFFKNMPEQSAQFLGMIIAIVIIVGMAWAMNKKKPEDEQEVVQE